MPFAPCRQALRNPQLPLRLWFAAWGVVSFIHSNVRISVRGIQVSVFLPRWFHCLAKVVSLRCSGSASLTETSPLGWKDMGGGRHERKLPVIGLPLHVRHCAWLALYLHVLI